MKRNKLNKKKVLINTGLIILTLFVLFIVLFFSLRDQVLKRVINSKLHPIEKKYNLDINYENAEFSGISTINLSRLSVVPTGNDTLAYVDKISVSVKPIDVILNRLRFSDLSVSNSKISLKRKGNRSNYLFLLDKHSDSTKTASKSGTDYGSRVAVLMRAMFNHIPSAIKINHFTVIGAIDTNYFSFFLPVLDLKDSRFNTYALVTEDTTTSNWQISGLLDSHNDKLSLSIKNSDSLKVKIPFIKKRWNARFEFDSAGIELSFNRDLENITHLVGKAVLSRPLINHPRISPDDVEIEKSEIDYSVNIGTDYVEVDSASRISFNQTSFRPYIMYILKPTKLVTFKINEPEIDAQDFFISLPAGLFRNLEGIKVKGKLSFNLNFEYAVNQPDSLIFNAKLQGKGFSVVNYGRTNFTYINSPFVYTAYENGRPIREIIVGEENPDFKSLSQIPDYLKHAIMTSEDGQFYYHNGFVPDAIRHSIITNIKEKRFARGGSTISMQLVKNVFLNRSKNITRKLEEMLITWLIESRNMVSKDRMLEVYLNIIETGPGIYGVNEAAHFYFRKDVSKLTLAESVYIASIVPKPKLFKYSFDKQGNLREYLTSYYTLVSSKMLNRGWLTQEEFDDLRPEITLKGPARDYIVTDSIPDEIEILKERRSFFDFIKMSIFKKKKKE